MLFVAHLLSGRVASLKVTQHLGTVYIEFAVRDGHHYRIYIGPEIVLDTDPIETLKK